MTPRDPPDARSIPIPVVTIGWIRPFFDILDEQSRSPEELLRRAGLPTGGHGDGSAVVPTARVYDFVALARRTSALEDLGLRAGGRFDIAPLVPDAERSWQRPGVMRSIQGFIEIALESSSAVDMWIERRSGPVGSVEFFYSGTFGTEHPAFSTVEQFMIALMIRLTRHAAGSGWSPSQVRLRADDVPTNSLKALAPGALVRSQCEATSIVFPPDRYAGEVGPFPDRRSHVWRRHRRSLGRGPDDLVGSLRLVLPAYLASGAAGIETAAGLAGTSVRTLQRRLGEHGVTYSDLLDDLRHDLALYLLRDRDLSIGEVGQELGYRVPAVFTRAFRRWTGETPSSFRTTARRVSR